jgi:hypothetical protein
MNAHTRRHRGSAYLLVLTGSIAVAVAGLTAMHIARTARFATAAVPDQSQAQSLALAGLDHALLTLDTAADIERAGGMHWRDAITDDLTFGPYALGNGTFTWSLNDSLADDIVLTVAAQCVDAKHALQARIQTGEGLLPISSIEIEAYATELRIETGGVLYSDGTVGAIDKIDNRGTITADVECGDSIDGTVNGVASEFADLRTLPHQAALEYYIAKGTVIDPTLLPKTGSARYMQQIVLSPTNNPYGAENPEGIYVIPSSSDELVIQNCRIVGTLIVNSTQNTTITGAVNWEPALPNYPALMCAGNVTMNLAPIAGPQSLDETNAGGNGENVNFNPPHTPYRGATDGSLISDLEQLLFGEGSELLAPATHNDVYPCVIAGIVLVRGDLEFDKKSSTTIEGHLIVEGRIRLLENGTLKILSTNALDEGVPPGFRSALGGPPYLVPGSIARVTTP